MANAHVSRLSFFLVLGRRSLTLMGKMLLGTKLCVIAGLLAWSHPASAQTHVTITLGLGSNLGYDLDVTNDSPNQIDSFEVILNSSSFFDQVRNASTVPDVGGNNDGQEASAVTITPNNPIGPSSSWSTSGDIDGANVTAVDAVVNGVQFTLLESQPGLWTGSAPLVAGVPGGPDPGDMCASGPALDQGGCLWFPAATVYTYTGDVRDLRWEPHPDDMFRRDTMFYFAEIRTWPLDNLVTSLQTDPGVETFLWTPGAAGFYHAKVMACDPDLIESGDIVDLLLDEHCSPWADSMNDENTPAEVPGWLVYVAIKPPTGGGIE